MTGNGAPAVDPPRVTLEWDDEGRMHLVMSGPITYDHLIVGAFHLTKTANGIVDAMMRRQAEDDAPRPKPSPIVAVHGALEHEGRN